MMINEQKTVSSKTPTGLDEQVNKLAREGWISSNNLTTNGDMYSQQMYKLTEVPDIKKDTIFPNQDETNT